jgi:hypothetical protein
MFVVSAVLGAKYYPIPYRWGRLLLIFVAMGGVYGLSLLLDGAFSGWSLALKLGVHTILILFYLALAWGIIRKKS